MGKQGPSRGAENGKNKSRAFWPCSVGGMGGKEERFKEHLQMFFLDPKSHFHQSLNGSSGRLAELNTSNLCVLTRLRSRFHFC